MSTSTTLSKAWRARFGEVLPAGFLCREALSDRWLRIHSLPESKRYPADPSEMAELLSRHNRVAWLSIHASGL